MQMIFPGFIAPVLIVFIAISLAWMVWCNRSRADGRWIGAIAVATAFWLAFRFLSGTAPLAPGKNVAHWPIYTGMLVAILGLLDSLFQPRLWIRALTLGLIVRIAARLLLKPQLGHHLDPIDGEIDIDLITLFAVGWYALLESLAARHAGPVVPMILTILCTGAAALLMFSDHIASESMIAGALGAIAGGIVMATLWRPRIAINRGIVGVYVALLVMMLAHGYFYGNLANKGDAAAVDQLALLLLFIAPFSGCIVHFSALRGLPPRWRNFIRIALPALIILAATIGPMRQKPISNNSMPTVSEGEE